MIAAAALALAGCQDRAAPPTPTATSVTANGVTLTSVGATLPADDVALPAGPGRDAVEANCTSCHSPAMIVSQPKLIHAQWVAEVEKMQKAYHAPIDPQAVPAIVKYLGGLSGQP